MGNRRKVRRCLKKEKEKERKTDRQDLKVWGHSTVAECLPTVHRALVQS